MNRRMAIGLTLLILCVQGCVSSNFMHVGSKTYPPRPENYVIDVFIPIDAPVEVHQAIGNPKPTSELPANSVTIGRIDTNGAPAASWASVIEDAKKQARTLGGDAIVINQWGSPLTGMNGYGMAYHGKAVSMTVVRFRE